MTIALTRSLAAARLLAAIVVAVLGLIAPAAAHEVRPAYLQIDQTGADQYTMLWNTPLLSGMPLPVVLKLPDNVKHVLDPLERPLPGSILQKRIISVPDGLAGLRIEFVGLQATITDVLVRVTWLDGRKATAIIRPSQPWYEVPSEQSGWSVAWEYLKLGVRHILFGFDHLLFVFALILIVRSGRRLLMTVTAFTVAHSITLSLATLGLVHVPGPPVEATIALSILLLACEIIRLQHGQASLTAKFPWVVAFSFGLLHGFGFAGALTEIGLPQADIPLALFAFNVGVEVGQLAFIAVVLVALRAARLLPIPALVERYALSFATYAIGILAAYWFIERLAGFVA